MFFSKENGSVSEYVDLKSKKEPIQYKTVED